MANSNILLIKPVDGLGGEGDQVKVRAGGGGGGAAAPAEGIDQTTPERHSPPPRSPSAKPAAQENLDEDVPF